MTASMNSWIVPLCTNKKRKALCNAAKEYKDSMKEKAQD